MQLIVKNGKILGAYPNYEKVIDKFPGCYNIFVDDSLKVSYNQEKIIYKKPDKVLNIQSHGSNKNKITINPFDNLTPVIQHSEIKYYPLKQLHIRYYVSEEYHTSRTQIDLNLVLTKNKNRNELHIRQDLERYVSLMRWEKEVGGCDWNGWKVHTDRESQSKITAAYFLSAQGLKPSPFLWKFHHGFESITNEQMVDLGNTVLLHVQDVYDKESSLKHEIDMYIELEHFKQIDFSILH